MPAAIRPRHRDVAHPGGGPADRGRLIVDHHDGAGLGRVTLQCTGLDQGREMGVDRRRRGEPDGLADLPDRRRIATFGHCLPYVIENLLLSLAEHLTPPRTDVLPRLIEHGFETKHLFDSS